MYYPVTQKLTIVYLYTAKSMYVYEQFEMPYFHSDPKLYSKWCLSDCKRLHILPADPIANV